MIPSPMSEMSLMTISKGTEACPAAQGVICVTNFCFRRATRLKQKFVTQMTPWAAGHASVPFEIVINDISDMGLGIIHDQPLELGLRHLVTVPREDGKKPLTHEYIVVRCDRR